MNPLQGSFIFEDRLISSYGESAIFSTSPCLTFSHIAKIVAQEEEISIAEEESVQKLKFDVVIQQILVAHGKKKIAELEEKLRVYKFGNSVYESLIGSGSPFVKIEI